MQQPKESLLRFKVWIESVSILQKHAGICQKNYTYPNYVRFIRKMIGNQRFRAELLHRSTSTCRTHRRISIALYQYGNESAPFEPVLDFGAFHHLRTGGGGAPRQCNAIIVTRR